MNRRTVALGILAVWLVALGWLVRREVLAPSGELLGTAALRLPPGATYYRITAADAQVGFSSTTIDTLPDTLRVTDVLVLEVPVGGEIEQADAQTEVMLTRDLALREFRSWFRSAGSRFAARGVVIGDTLQVAVETPGDVDTLHLLLDHRPILPNLLPLEIAFGGPMEVGRMDTLRIFDPLRFHVREVRLTVEAESTFIFPDSAAFDSTRMQFVPVLWDTVQAFAVRQEGAGPVVRQWIDRVGQVLRTTSGSGVETDRSVFEVAYENFRRGIEARRTRAATQTLERRTPVAAGTPLRPASRETLAVRITGLPLDAFDLEGAGQTRHGDTVSVRRLRLSAVDPDYSLRRPPGARFAPWMRAEPLIQSDDVRIEAQARQIVGRTRRPITAVRELTEWIHGTLAKTAATGVPSAVAVLEARGGDSNEHATLFVALARALRIPARPVAGLVLLDGRFHYHAWAEVWLGEWVPVDPLLGQFPADAGRVRLVLDGLARQVDLLPLLARVSLDVLHQAPE